MKVDDKIMKLVSLIIVVGTQPKSLSFGGLTVFNMVFVPCVSEGHEFRPARS